MHKRFNLPSKLKKTKLKIKEKPAVGPKPGQKTGEVRFFNKIKNEFFTNENYDLIGED